MSTHNICFCGDTRKISAFLGCKKHPICCYVKVWMSNSLPVNACIVCILSPKTDNCPSWISRRERMTLEKYFLINLHKECCIPGRGWTCSLLITSNASKQRGQLTLLLLICVYTVCSGMSVRTFCVNMVDKSKGDQHLIKFKVKYHNYPKYWGRQAWANSVDPDQSLQNTVWSGSTLFATHPALF